MVNTGLFATVVGLFVTAVLVLVYALRRAQQRLAREKLDSFLTQRLSRQERRLLELDEHVEE
jgi:biopolymer transport protein ExbB/TolQ